MCIFANRELILKVANSRLRHFVTSHVRPRVSGPASSPRIAWSADDDDFIHAGLCCLLGTGLGLACAPSYVESRQQAGYLSLMMWFTPVLGGATVVLVGLAAVRATSSAKMVAHGSLRTTLDWPEWIVLRRQKSKMGQGESRNSEARRILHRFFELGILIKGVDGGIELVGGLLLVFLSPAAINRVMLFFVEGELKEDPTDLVANLLLHTTRSAIEAKVPASVFLIVHGIVKLVLVGGLATNRLWSYPAAILVFAGLTMYQLYQLKQQYSLFLETVTVLDVIVILLVIAEYRYMRIARTS